MGKKIGVLLIDDQKTNCDIVEDILADEEDIELLGFYQYIKPFEYHLAKNPPDIALIDIQLAENKNGVDVLHWVLQNQPQVKSIMLTAERSYVHQSLQAGASAYVLKERWEDLAPTIREVYQGDIVIPNKVAEVLVDQMAKEEETQSLAKELHQYTEREVELMKLLKFKNEKSTIIRKMGISPFTFKRHLQNIRAKSGIFELDELVQKYQNVL